MGIEIERRFLVKNEDWRPKVVTGEDLIQGYLNDNSDQWTIRVRIINNNKSYITLKSFINGLTNYEYEYQIPNKDAIELLNLSKYKITKTRYQLRINERHWVVDAFSGQNSSLTIAEIELTSESDQVEIPTWCGSEITGINSLSNCSLAKTPISKISIKDRIEAMEA